MCWNALKLSKKCAEFSAHFLQSLSAFQHISAHYYVKFLRWIFRKFSAFQRISYIIFGKFLDPGANGRQLQEWHQTKSYKSETTYTYAVICRFEPKKSILYNLFSKMFCWLFLFTNKQLKTHKKVPFAEVAKCWSNLSSWKQSSAKTST